MIRRTNVAGGQQTEFFLETESPVSVVGEFNGWDPDAGAMQPSSESVTAMRSWSTHLAPGRYAFRYLDAHGNFFDDSEADAYESNGYGGFHGVIVVAEVLGTDADEAPAGADETPAGRAAKKAPAKKTPAKKAPAKKAPAKK